MERSSFEAVIPHINSAFRILFFLCCYSFSNTLQSVFEKGFLQDVRPICGRFLPG